MIQTLVNWTPPRWHLKSIMASKINNKNPLRDLTPTEADLDENTSSSSSSSPAPSSSSSNRGETLREKASKKLHGPDANPSQLGDPVSLKAETSEHIPKPAEAGAQGNSSSSSSSSESTSAQTARTSSSRAGGETLREKATKKLKGPNANPSQLGDPISLKAETSDNVPKPSEEGASKRKRSSRL